MAEVIEFKIVDSTPQGLNGPPQPAGAAGAGPQSQPGLLASALPGAKAVPAVPAAVAAVPIPAVPYAAPAPPMPAGGPIPYAAPAMPAVPGVTPPAPPMPPTAPVASGAPLPPSPPPMPSTAPVPAPPRVGAPGPGLLAAAGNRPLKVEIISPLPLPVSIAGGAAPRPAAAGATASGPSMPAAAKPFSTGAGVQAVDAATGSGGNAIQYIAATAAALGPVGVAAAAASLALVGLSSAANSAAERYGGFSASITMAQAKAELREMQGDMRRAQMLGDTLGKFVDAQSKASDKWDDVKAKFLNSVVPTLTGMLNGLTEALTWLSDIKESDFAKGMRSIDESIAKWAKGTDIPFLVKWGQGVELMLKRITDNTEPILDPDAGSLLDRLRDLMAPGGIRAMQPFVDPRLNMPVFGGV